MASLSDPDVARAQFRAYAVWMRGSRAAALLAILAVPACLAGVSDDAQPPRVDGRGDVEAAGPPGDSRSAFSDAGGQDASASDSTALPPAAIACSLVGDPLMPSNIGGTRLRPLAWTSPDGLDVPAGARDTLLGVDCNLDPSFSYCTPPPIRFTSLVKIDDTCKLDGIVGPAGLADAAIVQTFSQLHELIHVGAEIVPTPNVFTGGSAVNCVGHGTPGQSAFNLEGDVEPKISTHVYTVVSRAPLAELAAGTHFHCVDPFVDAMFAYGKDGSKLFTGELVDEAHNGPSGLVFPSFLHVTPDGQGGARWLPGAADQWCSTGGKTYVSTPIAHDVFFNGSVYQLLPGTTHACDVVPAYNGNLAYNWFLGSVVPLAEFDQAGAVDIGGARLRTKVRTAGAARVPTISPPQLFDAVLGQPCHPEIASDGLLRCLPPDRTLLLGGISTDTTAFVAYSDAACTAPIALTSSGAPKPAVVRDIRTKVGRCSSSVYAVGAQIETPVSIYGRYSDGAAFGYGWDCSACYAIPAVGSVDAYAITGEMPADAFAAMTIEVR